MMRDIRDKISSDTQNTTFDELKAYQTTAKHRQGEIGRPGIEINSEIFFLPTPTETSVNTQNFVGN
jgi:hypothetical protein